MRIFLILASLLLPITGFAVQFPESITIDSIRLVKKGEGTFRWTFFKVYNGAFYVDASSKSEPPLSDVSKQLVLEYNLSIDAKDFVDSGNELLKENLSPEEFASLEARLNAFNKAYQSVKKGDRYSLTYIKNKGTSLALNGEELVLINGHDFAAAYFGIWLGLNPLKSSFKKQLLGE